VSVAKAASEAATIHPRAVSSSNGIGHIDEGKRRRIPATAVPSPRMAQPADRKRIVHWRRSPGLAAKSRPMRSDAAGTIGRR
jgi:hypothetical protein